MPIPPLRRHHGGPAPPRRGPADLGAPRASAVLLHLLLRTTSDDLGPAEALAHHIDSLCLMEPLFRSCAARSSARGDNADVGDGRDPHPHPNPHPNPN